MTFAKWRAFAPTNQTGVTLIAITWVTIYSDFSRFNNLSKPVIPTCTTGESMEDY